LSAMTLKVIRRRLQAVVHMHGPNLSGPAPRSRMQQGRRVGPAAVGHSVRANETLRQNEVL